MAYLDWVEDLGNLSPFLPKACEAHPVLIGGPVSLAPALANLVSELMPYPLPKTTKALSRATADQVWPRMPPDSDPSDWVGRKG